MQGKAGNVHRIYDAEDLLLPERGARRGSAFDRAPRSSDIEDAVFEEIPVTRLRRDNDNNSFGTRPNRKAPASKSPGPVLAWIAALSPQALMTLVGALFFLNLWMFGGLSGLFAKGPVQEPATPFRIENVSASRMESNGLSVLEVRGRLENATRNSLPAPDLVVLSREGGAPIGTVRLAGIEVPAGGAMRFAGRLRFEGGKTPKITVLAQSD